MKLEELAAFDLGVEAGFLHSSTVQLKGRQGILFVYSAGPAVDPGEECFRIQGIQPVHVALFEMNGRRIWDKQLPDGVLPGIWFVPVLPFDMNRDGEDEIYVLNNTGALKGAILDRKGRIIARLPDEPERYAEGTVRMGRLLPHAGEQLMIAERDGTCVHIYGDAEACDGPIMQKRYAMPYLTFMQKLMSSGYNCIGSQGSCGV